MPKPKLGIDIFECRLLEDKKRITRVKRVSRIHHRTILLRGRYCRCIQLTHLTLVCGVIRYRLVQVRQNLKNRTEKKTFRGWQPAGAFLYLFLFHSLRRLLPFFLNTQSKSITHYNNYTSFRLHFIPKRFRVLLVQAIQEHKLLDDEQQGLLREL